VDVSSSCSISASISEWCSLSWADVLRATDSAQGRDVCEYAYQASKLMIKGGAVMEVLLDEVGGNPG
jgi:hypothetical protein